MSENTVSSGPVDINALFSVYDEAAVRRDVAEAAKVGGVRTVNLSKLPPGTYSFRVLPPKPGVQSAFRTVHKHFIKGGEKTRVVVCAKCATGAECGACVEVEALKATGNASDMAIAKDMEPAFEVVFAAIDEDLPPDPENPMANFCLVSGKKSVYGDLLKLHGNRAAGGDFTHPITGFTVAITKEGAGMTTEYKVAAALSGRRPFDTVERMTRVLMEMPDISQRDLPPSAEEVEAVLVECGFRAPPPAAGATASSMLGRNFGNAQPRRR